MPSSGASNPGLFYHRELHSRSTCCPVTSSVTRTVTGWNLHIRQRLARFGRKRLAFSKPGAYHRWVTKWFIHEYNLSVSTSD